MNEKGKIDSNAVNCVKGEIHNVLSIMRINERWASGDRFEFEIPSHTESPLLQSFKKLHGNLVENCIYLSDFDTLNYLEPFLNVIVSDKTNGMITGAALSSINKFLLYDFVTDESLRGKESINLVAFSISRCRFEETDREMDELVLIKLLELLEYSLRCSAGYMITGKNVWRMVNTCYTISRQKRASLHLSHIAENTLAHLVLTVFNRLTVVESYVQETIVFSPKQIDVKGKNGKDDVPSFEVLLENELQGVQSGEDMITVGCTDYQVDGKDEALLPYGVPVLKQILIFLAGLIEPKVNSDETRILGLSLINIVLETGGTKLGKHDALVKVMQGDLSKFLLQNSESNDVTTLSVTLRVVFNLFNSIKDHLKVQLEVFFTSVHLRIIDSPSCTDEQKELAMESLVEFCREPALMLDLYINYDCDVHCTNLFEVLCKSLSKHAKSSTGRLNVLHLLALEGLLAVFDNIARRCEPDHKLKMIASLKNANLEGIALSADQDSPTSSTNDDTNLSVTINAGTESESDSDTNGLSSNADTKLNWLHSARDRTAEVMQQRKRTKKKMMLAAENFNNDRKGWISYGQQLGLLTNPVDAESIARFLLQTPGLDKTIIGDFLGDGPVDKKPLNEAVRNAYVELFDFNDLRIDQALRLFLEKFRLPGEAQKIDRMMEAFSKHLYKQCPQGPLANEDAAFVLAFSIIMLNTDLHNGQIMKKMTIEEFIRNNRGINDGKDLPREYLTDLYINLRDNEIQMRQEVGDIGADSSAGATMVQWDGVLKRSQNVVGASFTSNASIRQMKAGLYECEMFRIIAEITISSISVAFEQTSDPVTMLKAMEGLQNCAKIAVYFDSTDMLNQLVITLCKYFLRFASTLISGELVLTSPISGAAKTERSSSIDSNDGQHSYSEKGMLAKRALVALELVFSLVHKYGNYFRNAWTDVVECILCLNELDVLPASIVEMDDFVDARGVPLISATDNAPSLSPNINSSNSGGQPNATTAGMSGRVRERARRRAEQRALAKARNATQSSNSGLWGSISSLLWAEEVDDDDADNSIKELFADSVAKCGLELGSWVKFCKHLNSASLMDFLRALIVARDPLRSTTNISDGAIDPMLQENAVLAVELMTNIVLANQDRLEGLWLDIHAYFERILHNHGLGGKELKMSLLVERVAVNLLRVCVRLLHHIPLSGTLLKSLRLLQGISESSGVRLSERISFGVLMLLKANAVYMEEIDGWQIIFEILQFMAAFPGGREHTFGALAFLVESGNVTNSNFALWYSLATRYVDGFANSTLKPLEASIGSKLLQQFAASISCVDHGTSLSNYQLNIINEQWVSVVYYLYSKLDSSIPTTRQNAWDNLHATLVFPGANISAETWNKCFTDYLFHLASKLRYE